MENSVLKEKLHQVIENGDERLLELLYEVVKDFDKQEIIFPGEPFSSSQLIQRIMLAKARVDKGEFISMKELEKESENW
ncbi:hypothetical protein Aoki45_32780 [Algoriphagus sp. oki45]|uniref:hypothetical protein n=1 Tax=Algoriphagus sp. oki45 TaxID=3067294 RepID=UPI0027EEAF56|nr:hypothetical protein Aoki45_32780 [Algoriphagus sp. oki45]